VAQSQWDRPVRTEWLFLGALLVIGARIRATFLDPGWAKAVLESLFPMTASLFVPVFLHGRAYLTARRVALIPVLAMVLGTVFEVGRRWGWWIAAPLVVLTFVLVYRAARSGVLAPSRDAPSST
jgi:hypothetical protein